MVRKALLPEAKFGNSCRTELVRYTNNGMKQLSKTIQKLLVTLQSILIEAKCSKILH